MDPATVAIILGALVKYTPDIAEAMVDLFHKPNPTREDFRILFSKVRTYEEIVAAKKPPTA